MPAEEMGQRFFTRERIRNRLLKKAAEVWGYAESEMDEFDPLVTLLIEACSVEFERIASEVGKTQNRMLERLAQLMYPEITMVRPSYGIMQAVSAEPYSTLHTDSQFMFKLAGNSRNGAPANYLYFSAARDAQLVNGRLRCMATCREFYSIEEGVQKIQLAASSRKSPHHEYSLWLGLQLDADIDSLEGISFFFNWMNDPEAETWYQYLPFAQWSLKGHAIQVAGGFPEEKDRNAPIDLLEHEFDSIKRIEIEVMDIFRRQFANVVSSPSFEKIKLTKEPYPALFEQWFAKADLQDVKDPLVWVEIKFPTMVSPEALDNLLCNINCFPVLNRKLNKLNYKLQQNLNIVPLNAEGSFLSVKEIITTSGNGIKLIPFGNPYDLQPETYTMRYGVNRFNERNSYETLVNLLDLIREESSFFSSLGEDFLAQHIRELNQILARMESRIKLQNKHEAPFPFLAIRSGKEGNTVGIEFWTCMGEAANKIPMGTKLLPYQHSNVKTENLYLMTTTAGGRDNMSDADKLVHYKKALFTRNRIVTPEDLRVVVLAELGQSAKSVEIRKSFVKGALPGEGFMRCILVTVVPAEDDETDEAEWDQKLLRLKIILEKQSANNLPYHISLQNVTA
jgi:hypothetical protein